MMNKDVKGILALVVVTALSFGVIFGTGKLTKNSGESAAENTGTVQAELDVSGAENIERAVQMDDGSYVVSVKAAGYGGDIHMDVTFDESGKVINSLAVTEQSETENLGAKITEEEFLSQFSGIEAPVYLPGMTLETGDAGEEQEDSQEPQADPLDGAVFADGTYEAKADAPDDNGFTEQVTMTVENGKITQMNWDSISEDGTKKSDLAKNGEYVMTEDGLNWAEQSQALTDAVIENQSLGFLTMDEQTKTDAVAGVSISVGSFEQLARQCMEEAAGISPALTLTDGTYEAQADEADDNGFTEQVTMTVANGKITEMNWDSISEDGTKKSDLAKNGEYVMTEDGLNWAEQSQALTDAVIENQSLGFLTMDEQTKTDAVAGVSISVGSFEQLARQCMEEAAGISPALTLTDGTYEAQADEADDNGFTEQVTMTVANGKITEMNWDSISEDGTKKSDLAKNGEYVMTEDGLNWAEQSQALTDAVIENQSLDFLTMDEQTKTDAVAGVSISVGSFADLAQQCIRQAGGETAVANTEESADGQADASAENTQNPGTQIDAVSGATISSTAVVTGINEAYEFLQSAK